MVAVWRLLISFIHCFAGGDSTEVESISLLFVYTTTSDFMQWLSTKDRLSELRKSGIGHRESKNCSLIGSVD